MPTLNNAQLNDRLARALVDFLPYILFFDDFRDSVEERIEILSDRHAASGWLSILEQLFRQTSPDFSVFDLRQMEERRRKSVLAKVKRNLNTTLTAEWQHFRLDERDALEISIDFEEEHDPDGQQRSYLKLDIIERDANDDEHYFFISDRSKGFYWFFNFVMKLEFNPKILEGHEGNTIYLLDEPGSYLHASAQSKLCGKLRQLATRNRVIYCTHSHYLLDPEIIPLSNILVVDKDGTGSIQLASIYDHHGSILERRSAFQPVLDALQVKPFAFDLNYQELVVITEGIYDYYCLEMFKAERPIGVLPSVGAGSIVYYVSLMIAWQIPFVALWDNDEAGRREFDRGAEKFGIDLAKKHFRLLPLRGKARQRIAQDLFAGGDLRRIRESLNLPPNSSFDKTIATLFYSSERGEVLSQISDETRENFREVFVAIRVS